MLSPRVLLCALPLSPPSCSLGLHFITFYFTAPAPPLPASPHLAASEQSALRKPRRRHVVLNAALHIQQKQCPTQGMHTLGSHQAWGWDLRTPPEPWELGHDYCEPLWALRGAEKERSVSAMTDNTAMPRHCRHPRQHKALNEGRTGKIASRRI